MSIFDPYNIQSLENSFMNDDTEFFPLLTSEDEEVMNSEETEGFVANVKDALAEIDGLEVSQHGERYLQLHRNLESALTTIDGL